MAHIPRGKDAYNLNRKLLYYYLKLVIWFGNRNLVENPRGVDR